MQRANAVSVWGAVFVALVCIALISLQLSPVEAQATDPLEGQTAFIEDTDDDGVVVMIGPIAVADCEADPNVTASLTVADADGTEETFTDGENAELQFASNGITITALEGEDLNVPDDFSPGTGTVVSSTGITCGDGGTSNGGPDATQYDNDGNVDDADDVIEETVPKKPLPKTGGAPLVLGAGLLLACVALLSARILRP